MKDATIKATVAPATTTKIDIIENKRTIIQNWKKEKVGSKSHFVVIVNIIL